MKTFKKLTALILAVLMIVCLAAACGGGGQQDGGTPSGGTPSTGGTPSGGDSGDGDGGSDKPLPKIIMTFATAGVEPPDLPLVEEKLNEMTRRDIGVEVEFLPISVFELASTVPTKVIGGEQIDVFMMAFTGNKIYEQMNLLNPINDYITEENAPYIYSHQGPDGTDIDMNGNVYSVKLPLNEPICGGFQINKADLEAAGLGDKYHDYDLVTLDDLTEIFKAIKAVYPDKYPCGIVGSASRSSMTFVYDTLGDGINSGVLVGYDSTTVENYFASEPYKNYLQHVRQWYLDGYVPKDAATTDINLVDYMNQGIISGYFNAFKDSSLKQAWNIDSVYLQTTDYYYPSTSPTSNVYFGVPVTSSDPEAAVRFIDYMIGNADVGNLLTFGIKGTHWVDNPDNPVGLDMAEGVTAENSRYSYGFGFYSNRTLDGIKFEMGAHDPTILTVAETMERGANHYTKGYGVVFDSSPWTTQLQQISTVTAQYIAALETGSADLDTVYPEFLAALDANGMAEVVEAKNAWFQDYLASHQ